MRGEDEDGLFPKFSLGLSQVTPKNLGTDIDGTVDSPDKEKCRRTGHSIKRKAFMEYEVHETEARHKLKEKGIKYGGLQRPHREIKASHFCKLNKMIWSTVLDT